MEKKFNIVKVSNIVWGLPLTDDCCDWTELPKEVTLDNGDDRYCTVLTYRKIWEAELEEDLEEMYGRELIEFEAEVETI